MALDTRFLPHNTAIVLQASQDRADERLRSVESKMATLESRSETMIKMMEQITAKLHQQQPLSRRWGSILGAAQQQSTNEAEEQK
jgi:hypothetical protein